MSRIDLEFEDRQARQRLSEERSINLERFFEPETDRGVVYPAFLKDDIGEYSGGYVVVGRLEVMIYKLEKDDEVKGEKVTRKAMIRFFKEVVEHLESGDKAIIDLDEQRLKRAKLRGDKWPLFLRYLHEIGEMLLSRELEEVKQADFNLELRKKELERLAAKFFGVPEFRVIISESKDA